MQTQKQYSVHPCEKLAILAENAYEILYMERSPFYDFDFSDEFVETDDSCTHRMPNQDKIDEKEGSIEEK